MDDAIRCVTCGAEMLGLGDSRRHVFSNVGHCVARIIPALDKISAMWVEDGTLFMREVRI